MFKVRGLILSFICVLCVPGFVSAVEQQQSAGLSRQMKRLHEYERLQRVLEESNPKLCEQFVPLSEKSMTRAKLAAQDKKAIGAFLDKVEADLNLNQQDKKAIAQFLRSGLSTGAKVGIGLGSAAAVIALISLVARRRMGIVTREMAAQRAGILAATRNESDARLGLIAEEADRDVQAILARAGGGAVTNSTPPLGHVVPNGVADAGVGAVVGTRRFNNGVNPLWKHSVAALGNGAGRVPATSDRVHVEADLGAAVVTGAAAGVVGGVRSDNALLDMLDEPNAERLKKIEASLPSGSLQLALSECAYPLKQSGVPSRLVEDTNHVKWRDSCARETSPWGSVIGNACYDELAFHPEWFIMDACMNLKSRAGSNIPLDYLRADCQVTLDKQRIEILELTLTQNKSKDSDEVVCGRSCELSEPALTKYNVDRVRLDQSFVTYLSSFIFSEPILAISKIACSGVPFYLVSLGSGKIYLYGCLLHDDGQVSFALIKARTIADGYTTVFYFLYFLSECEIGRLQMSPARLAWMGTVARGSMPRPGGA
jgi:hypothetical protein